MEFPNIIWKDIKGYEGYYQVSTRGQVRSKNRIINYCTGRVDYRLSKIMKPKRSHNGYLMVELSKNNTRRTFKIHRLVAEAFIPNPFNKPQVNHLDFCRDCNGVENLEWVTAQENVRHAKQNGRGNNWAGSKNIRAVFLKGCDCCFLSIRDAADHLKLSYGHVQAVLSGKRKNTIGIGYCK